ncbi:hypothetical protein PENNAL_c0476G11257 [Penicillium nalgiovense]|uniref:Uncharacterized protein n=1 Tax=Penicillium nalgiovense TaxID=60175 RepID=A0A1V6VR54_PENNA|nr:hypothetical protein PENNAL_c0476G11257 [Penicillium nalgiovense]
MQPSMDCGKSERACRGFPRHCSLAAQGMPAK